MENSGSHLPDLFKTAYNLIAPPCSIKLMKLWNCLSGFADSFYNLNKKFYQFKYIIINNFYYTHLLIKSTYFEINNIIRMQLLLICFLISFKFYNVTFVSTRKLYFLFVVIFVSHFRKISHAIICIKKKQQKIYLHSLNRLNILY